MSSSSKRSMTRRSFLQLLVVLAGGVGLGAGVKRGLILAEQPKVGVSILKAPSYDQDLFELLKRGLGAYPAFLERIAGARVLLKPNLVDHASDRAINTHPAVIQGALEAFRYYGASEVVIAEAPGTRRDTELLVSASGLGAVLRAERVPFVDLNLDDLVPLKVEDGYTGLDRLYFPRSVLEADLVVSMPKLKTHHLAGVTLSLKNMFGVMPGVKYGWPKNLLHARGIDNSIVDINLTLKPHFAIVDGVEGMEGDGPIYGQTVPSGVVLLGDDLTAVDATGARLMGIYPEHIPYLLLMRLQGGTLSESRIQHLGERLEDVKRDFAVLPQLQALKAPPSLLRRLFFVG